MGATSKVTWLRASYRIGAAVDFIAAIMMLWSAVGGSGSESGHLEARRAAHAMSIVGSLMVGWGCLLLWADRKPIERKGVLMVLAIPTAIWLIIPGSFAIAQEVVPIYSLAFTSALQVLVLSLFVFSYYNARGLEQT